MFYNLSKHAGHCLHTRYGQFTCSMFLHHEYRVFCQLYLLLGLAVRSGHLGCLLRGHIYQEGLSPTACITHTAGVLGDSKTSIRYFGFITFIKSFKYYKYSWY